MDTSLKRTLFSGPEGVRLQEVRLVLHGRAGILILSSIADGILSEQEDKMRIPKRPCNVMVII